VRHLKQTRYTNCGQTVVAMITGRPIAEVEELMGTQGCTSTWQLRCILIECGFATGPTERIPRSRPWEWFSDRRSLLLFVRHGPKEVARESNHWSLWDGAKQRVLDPALPKSVSSRTFRAAVERLGGQVTSVVAVRRGP